MSNGLRFVLHLFFEDLRIPFGVLVAMVVTGLEFVPHFPQWVSDVGYLGIIQASLIWSVLAAADHSR